MLYKNMNFILVPLFIVPFLLFSTISTNANILSKKEIRRGQVYYIDNLIEHANTKVDKDLIRAIAWGESEWKQLAWEREDSPTDFGLMQIHGTCIDDKWNLEKVKYDTAYNLHVGIVTMEKCLKDAKRIRHKYHISKKHSDEDVALKMYNGWQKSWKYVRYIRRIQRERPWEKFHVLV